MLDGKETFSLKITEVYGTERGTLGVAVQF